MKGDLAAFGELLRENWENQKRLHPSVTNEKIEQLFDVAREAVRSPAEGRALGRRKLALESRALRDRIVRQSRSRP